jgi:hypothetical protein
VGDQDDQAVAGQRLPHGGEHVLTYSGTAEVGGDIAEEQGDGDLIQPAPRGQPTKVALEPPDERPADRGETFLRCAGTVRLCWHSGLRGRGGQEVLIHRSGRIPGCRGERLGRLHGWVGVGGQ